MRRLYVQIYVTVVGILLLLALLLSLAWFAWPPGGETGGGLDTAAAVAEQIVPGRDATHSELERALERLSETLDVSLSLSSADGSPVASAGERLPAPDPSWSKSRILPYSGRGLTMALRLSDGRFLVVRHHRSRRAFGALAAMALAAAVVALGSYPLVRRLTRRLERLQARVEALGRGRLDARVEIEGRDEVAMLALSFNEAAARIERLVEGQRALLAGASHELRSPLTRIRVAVELLGERVPPEIRSRIERDICELDELIGELILASRLETGRAVAEREEIFDVLALAAEEGSRYDAVVSGAPVEISADRALVRRLVRNLLENARRHAPGASVEIDVRPLVSGRGARIRVMDRGAGVPEEERERVFEPFYQLQRPPGSGSEKGVGLGLALVRRIARLHGGEARCLPREGGGAILEVELGGERAR